MSSILITGASRGFGLELFNVYAKRGWTTYPLVRDPEVAIHLESSTQHSCYPIVSDITAEQLEEVIEKTLGEHCEKLDILMNNAGNIIKRRGLENTFPNDLNNLFRVHCIGVLRCTKAALPYLAKAKRPVVVNISSRFGSISRVLRGKGTTIYSYPVAKCAQNMLTACLDQELKDRGIRVFAVHPGRLKTEVGAPDADTDPRTAAIALADWIDRVDDQTVSGFHDIMNNKLIEW
jgi:NAD(P)-dependent dehydrogenase (short-subunit alcohol dehydrogenase family)